MTFTISKRIGLSYFLMALLLAAIGGAGLYGADRISGVLDRVTGPIDGTTRAVDNGIRGVLLQMSGVDMALDGRDEAAKTRIGNGEQLAAQSFEAINAAGLVSRDRLGRVEAKMGEFDATRKRLLQLHQDYLASYHQLLETIEKNKDLLLVIEEQASQALVNLEWNAGLAEDESSNARDTEEWAIVGAAADARLALMTRLFDYHQLTDAPDNAELLETAGNSLGDLLIYLETLAESEMLNGKPVGKGPFAKQTFDAALLQLHRDNESQFNAALDTLRKLEQSRTEYSTVAQTLMQEARLIEQESRQIVEQELAAAADSRQAALWLIIGLIIAGLALAFIAFVTSLRTIAAPLCRVSARMREIARGDGDLTARLEVNGKDEIAEVSQSFNEFAEKIRNTVTEVSQAVKQLAGSSEKLDQLTDTSVQRTRRQQDETQQIATATQEMSLTVKSVAESAEGAKESAQQAHNEADAGRAVVSGTIDAINGLGDQVDLAATTIQELEQESENIGGVIDVIGEIAEQTNLLALNAAIEAARAGEQGRGFSVVADEVRTLANRTQKSTTEILAMIERLQSQARKAGQAMQQSRSMARETVEKGETTGSSLDNIVESVATIRSVNQQIATAAGEQRSAAEEISQSVVRINGDAEDIVADNQDMSESARDLAALAERLDTLVSQFRT